MTNKIQRQKLRPTLLITCMMIATYSMAQNPINYSEFPDTIIKAHKIAEVQCDQTNISLKGKKNVSRAYARFDVKGFNHFNIWLSDTLKNIRIVSYRSEHRDKYKYEIMSHENSFYWDEPYFNIYLLNNKNNVYSSQNFDKKGKMTFYNRWTWKDSTLLTIEYFNRKNKNIGTYKNFYNTEKQLTRTERYDKKGKLKQAVNYDCDAMGKVVEKKSEDLKACTEKKHLADGSVVTIETSFDYVGKPYRRVSVIDSLKRETYYEYTRGDKYTYTFIKSTKYAGEIIVQSYNKSYFGRSKNWNSSIINYNENGQIVSRTDSFTSKKKINIESFVYTYNDKGLVETRTSNINGKLRTYAYFRYRYY
jgi:hypothetical protein